MSNGISSRVTHALHDWPVFAAPRRYVIFALILDVLALTCIVFALRGTDLAGASLFRACLLLALAVGYEEVASRTARLHLRLKSGLRQDMSSVWIIAAAVSLPAGVTAITLVGFLTYQWVRQQRPVGKPAHRAAFNISNAVLSAMTAGFVMHASHMVWDALPWALSTAAPILLAIVLYAVLNRALVTAGLMLVGVRGPSLLGTANDNLVELATLCLGGLVALAILHNPWLMVLAIAPMVTLQRGALVRELETAATTDSKTGLLNAITWEQIAQRELTRAARSDAPTAVMIVDVDRFKRVNDAFGHLAGDLVLRGVGQRMRDEVREYDTVGRFGGEEFVAVLPNAGDADALVVAERLRSRINTLRISDFVDDVAEEEDAFLAVSVGVACAPTDGNDLTDLLYAADAALYRAKAIGRNRVMLAKRNQSGGGRRMHVA